MTNEEYNITISDYKLHFKSVFDSFGYSFVLFWIFGTLISWKFISYRFPESITQTNFIIRLIIGIFFLLLIAIAIIISNYYPRILKIKMINEFTLNNLIKHYNEQTFDGTKLILNDNKILILQPNYKKFNLFLFQPDFRKFKISFIIATFDDYDYNVIVIKGTNRILSELESVVIENYDNNFIIY